MQIIRTCGAMAFAFWLGACASVAQAQPTPRVRINIDASLAQQTMALLCSGRRVDERAIRNSPLVQAQIQHNSGILPAATMDAYIAALRGASACEAPSPDTFQIGALIAEREAFQRKIDGLVANQVQIAADAVALLEPFLPAGFTYEGEVVLAVPYFSCGGFSAGERFFIDVRCLSEDVTADREALTLLVAHETYHAIQERLFFPLDETDADTRFDAMTLFLGSLVGEGSADYLAPPTRVPPRGGGMLTQINREFSSDNAGRMRSNFALFTLLTARLASASDAEAEAVFDEVYRIGFGGGTYQQMAYYVGAAMAGDIDRAWGRQALLCVYALAPEQFLLAHDAAAPGDARRLGPAAIDAAREMAAARGNSPSFETCRP